MKLEFKALTGLAMSAVGLSAFAQTASEAVAAFAASGASGASGVPGTTIVVVPPGGPTWLIAGVIAGLIMGFALGVLFTNRRQ